MGHILHPRSAMMDLQAGDFQGQFVSHLHRRKRQKAKALEAISSDLESGHERTL